MTSSIGQKLRNARNTLGLTLAELASETGFSTSYISQVERGVTNPSMSSLLKLSAVLSLAPSELLDQPSQEPCASVVRRDHRFRFRYSTSEVDYELLTADLRGKPFQFIWYRMPPGVTSGPVPLLHESGVECGFVLKGRLEVWVGTETYVLNEGDSIYFSGTIPHGWRYLGDEEGEALWVTSPPFI